ncbi:hypothetical protein BJX63DRAFT_426993 [Aspergillus granulosus]|uniref:Uncharacterized protein n=1 Tax=Aspergillus granulosus TaxID=176169 RepID=A0ABR4I463_9EURO
MNTLHPTERIDIMFIETTDPSCIMLVWSAEGDQVLPASFLTVKLCNGQYIENSYLEEGGIPVNGEADPFYKSAHWIASIPASKVDYYRKIVRLSLPHLRDWSVNVLLDPLRREGFINKEQAKDVERKLMAIMASNQEVVVKKAEEKNKKNKKKKEEEEGNQKA